MPTQELYMFLNVVIDVYIFMLLSRMLLPERDFHFNPALQMIKKATDGPIKALRLAPLRVNFVDLSPLVAALFVVVFRGLLFGALQAETHLPYSAASLQILRGSFGVVPGMLLAVVISLMRALDLLVQVLVVAWIIAAMTPQSYNAIARVVRVIYAPVAALGALLPGRRTWPATVLAIAALLVVHFAVYVGIGLALMGTAAISTQGLVVTAAGVIPLLFNALNLFIIILIIGAIMSWFSPDPNNALVATVRNISYALLRPFRFLPLQLGGIDFSPIVAILGYGYLLRISSQLIMQMLISLSG